MLKLDLKSVKPGKTWVQLGNCVGNKNRETQSRLIVETPIGWRRPIRTDVGEMRFDAVRCRRRDAVESNSIVGPTASFRNLFNRVWAPKETRSKWAKPVGILWGVQPSGRNNGNSVKLGTKLSGRALHCRPASRCLPGGVHAPPPLGLYGPPPTTPLFFHSVAVDRHLSTTSEPRSYLRDENGKRCKNPVKLGTIDNTIYDFD